MAEAGAGKTAAASRRAGTGPIECAPALTREALPALVERLLHKGRRGNPDVLLVRVDGVRVVVKDFAPRGRWARMLLGRLLTARELRAYRRLAGLDLVPQLLGRLDELALVLEYRPGRPLGRSLAGCLPAGFLRELEAGVEAMHARGVVHLDLRHRSNILAGKDGRPVLLDFASAICLDPDRWPGRGLISLLAAIDRRALDKWRLKLVG